MMKMDTLMCGATAASAALFAGSLFSFSTFVMPALRTLPAGEGIAAMQAINVAAPRSLLMLPMGALALGSVIVLARNAFGGGHASGADVPLRLAGAALGLLSVGITVVANVPLNNRLAELPATAASGSEWSSYIQSWTAWNHGRVAVGLVSAVLLAWAAARG